MNERKASVRVLSFLLALVMVFGLMPMGVLNVNAEETVLDAAIFCSDVHSNASIVGTVFSAIKTADPTFAPSTASFVGDTECSASSVTTQATNVYSTLECYYAYGSHDDSSGIENTTGVLYNGTYYAIYTISQSDMESYSRAKTVAESFASDIEAVDASKPLFIISHMPLHARRKDNDGAGLWCDAINAAAASRDIVFFWAHNHTGENSTDTSAYYLAKGSNVSVEDDSSDSSNSSATSSKTLAFTYMNAGYIGKNASRGGYVTTVKIYSDSLVFQDYNSSGAVSDNSYTHNVTVAREFATSTETAVTLDSISVAGKTEYYVGDELSLTVTATYSDNTTADVTADTTFSLSELTASGAYTVTATYKEKTDAIDIKVSLYDEDDNNLMAVEVFSPGATALTVTWDDEADAVLEAKGTFSDYVVYDLALTDYVADTETEYAMYLVEGMDTTMLALYHVAADGTLTSVPYTIEGDCVVFTTKLTGTFAYGVVTVPADYTLSSIAVANAEQEYFVGESLRVIDDFTVTATYTKEGAEDIVRTIYIYEENNNPDGYTINMDSFDMTTVGAYNVEIVYETVSTTFPINVWGDSFTVSDVTVDIGDSDYGVTSASVSVLEQNTVAEAVADVLSGDNYVAYDISLVFDEGYSETETTKTVTLPIPEGVNTPVVYFVSEDGATVTNMNAKKGDGVVTFETTHFSTYVIGESAEITVPNPGTEKVEGSGGTTTAYVLVDSLTAGGEYLIVNINSTGSGYALLNNSGYVSSVAVEVKEADGEYYIELDNSNAVWTAVTYSNGFNLTNTINSTTYYLLASGSNSKISINERTNSNRYWNYSGDDLGCYGGGNTHYIYYNNGFVSAKNNGSEEVYIYQKQDMATSVSGTYAIEGNPAEVTQGVDSPVTTDGVTTYTTGTLGYNITFTPDGGEATTLTAEEIAELGGTVTLSTTFTDVNGVTVNGDPKGIISSTDGTTVYYSGVRGTAVVKITYTWTDANDSTKTYSVDNYIEITTTAPVYTINMHKAELTVASGVTADNFASGTYYTYNSVTNTYEKATAYTEGTTYYTTPVIRGDEITAPIALKGIESGDIYTVWAVITKNGVDMGNVDDDRLYWVVSDPSIASVDSDTGIITFTGNDGTFTLTAYYLDENGEVLCEDTITISVTSSLYVVPGDGTNDFPEYPNQGAIRFDKTAVAQGNFSETGIAMVELSMTGVPYGTSTKTDVVIMVDMTASMSDDDVTAAESAVKELVETLVYDEENDKYDTNIQLFLDVFYSAKEDSSFATEEYFNCLTIGSATELTTALNKIDFTQSSDGGGTRYNLAMADVYETLNREGHADNQFVVFVSDGVATAYAPLTNGALGTTITGQNSETESLAAGWFDDEGEVTDTFKTEYYSYMIKTAGIPIYTVGANLTALSDAADVLNHMSSNYSPDGKTATGETKYSFTCTTSGGITDEVLEIFQNIGASIKEAATNVVVEDKIADEYTMTFSLPSGVTADEAGMDDFYIQVVSYTLDDNHEREENPEVLEKFLFNSDDGTITHTIGTTTCGDSCTHVTKTDGVVTAIDGTYFEYSSTEAEGEILTWKADKLDTNELALQYFVYLENSAGDVEAANQVDAGTYPTNEYATITYTNFNGKECQQYFPVPQMTWNGAQVTYLFYLVNDAGQPVNRAGKVVPFAEAVYVTVPVTFEVTWNEETGSENMLAENLFAYANVPDVYELYDQNASYEIRVYQTEGVDQGNNVKNYNYFIIDGSDTGLNSYETTKVFNTKAGTKYDDYGVYSAQAVNSVLYTSSKDDEGNTVASTVTVDYQTTDIDYANTTVAFAVVWKPELVEDTVVIDYGLDVVIDVYANDGMAAGVTGVSMNAPTDSTGVITINEGTYADALKVGAASVTSADGLWTASVESLTSVRFHMNEMGINDPAVFYYEAAVNYYTYDNAGTATLNTTNMYSKVTVIPATTVYYEDSYVDLGSYTWDYTNSKWAEVTEDDDAWTWTQVGTTISATQAVDRPGLNKAMSESYDADNNYGYDAAYSTCSEYSLGSALKAHVDYDNYATASFTFYGTGFDVVSLTSDQTGVITVKVYPMTNGVAATTAIKSHIVDSYYGYNYVDTDSDGVADTWQVITDSNGANALYQIPLMKVSGLDYGQYKVVITAQYSSSFDHAQYTDGAYDFYLDAIRIYDPVQTSDVVDQGSDAESTEDDTTVEDIYDKDNEGWPVYQELRNNVIDAASQGSVAGVVFIDGVGETAVVSDYTSYGPNNELYLAPGQAIMFTMNLSSYDVASLQIGLKSANGDEVSYYIFDSAAIQDQGDFEDLTTQTISTSTDMYYDITALKGATIVIFNNSTEESGAILSITNLKVTFNTDPGTVTANFSTISEDAVNTLVTAMNPVPSEESTESTEATTESTEATTESTEESTESTEGGSEDTGSTDNSWSGIIGKIVSGLRKWFGWG